MLVDPPPRFGEIEKYQVTCPDARHKGILQVGNIFRASSSPRLAGKRDRVGTKYEGVMNVSRTVYV